MIAAIAADCSENGLLARRGTREQSAGAWLVRPDTLTRVIQDRQKELRHRIRPRRVVSKRLQDAGGGLIVAAQDRANTVLGRGLRRGRCGEQRQHAHEKGTGRQTHPGRSEQTMRRK